MPQKKEKKKSCLNKTLVIPSWFYRRNELGVYNNLLRELCMEDECEYKKFLRMTTKIFWWLAKFKKKSTMMPNPILPNIKLAATIRFLSTEVNYVELRHVFRILQSTISKFIPEVHEAIYTRLNDTFLRVISFIYIK